MNIRRQLLACGTTCAIGIGLVPRVSLAHSPVPPKATYSFSWTDLGDGDGVIEPPYESAYGKIMVSFEPKGGELVTITTPSGPQEAYVRALRLAWFDMPNVKNGETGKLNLSSTEPFGPTGMPWTVVNGGRENVEVVQLCPWPDPSINIDNPCQIFEIFWDPQGDYTPREVTYVIKPKTTLIAVEPLSTPGFWSKSVIPPNEPSVEVTFKVGPQDHCVPDCDGNGAIDIDDFICYQTFFALGDPAADCDGDGVLLIDDFICFQTAFVLGC